MVSHRIEQHRRFREVVKSCEHIRDTEDSHEIRLRADEHVVDLAPVSRGVDVHLGAE